MNRKRSGSSSQREPDADPHLLRLLLRPGPHSVQSLAAQRGLTTADITAALDRLQRIGCELERHPQHGVRLIATAPGTWADYLHHVGGAHRVIEVYRETASTQDAAKRLAAARGAAAAGAVVVAEHQTAGRGRLGRRWVSQRGRTLTFSYVHLAPGPSPVSNDALTLATTVAVARAVDGALAPAGKAARVKWPNDLVVEGRKLAGILVETQKTAGGAAAIIGVGINLTLDSAALAGEEGELTARATSLAACGARADRLALLADTVLALDAALANPTAPAIVAGWRERSVLLQHHARLRSDGREVRGQVVDVDPEAGLIVRADSGELVHLPAATTTVLSDDDA